MDLIKAEMKEHYGAEKPQLTAHHEKMINKTLYIVTSVYKGEIDFAKAMEDLIIRKILREDGAFQDADVVWLSLSTCTIYK